MLPARIRAIRAAHAALVAGGGARDATDLGYRVQAKNRRAVEEAEAAVAVARAITAPEPADVVDVPRRVYPSTRIDQPALRLLVDEMVTCRLDRRQRRPRQVLPMRDRMLARYRVLVAAEFGACGYRRTQSSWVGGNHVTTIEIGDCVRVSGMSETVWHRSKNRSGTDSAHHVTVMQSWIRTVYARGLSRVGGLFVLDAGSEVGGKIPVSVVEQGRGFTLHFALRFVTRGADGGYVFARTPRR